MNVSQEGVFAVVDVVVDVVVAVVDVVVVVVVVVASVRSVLLRSKKFSTFFEPVGRRPKTFVLSRYSLSRLFFGFFFYGWYW